MINYLKTKEEKIQAVKRELNKAIQNRYNHIHNDEIDIKYYEKLLSNINDYDIEDTFCDNEPVIAVSKILKEESKK